MLEQLKDKAEIIIVINAGDIEKNKVRGDLGITYDSDVLRLIDAFRVQGPVCGQRGGHPVHRASPPPTPSSRGWRSLGVQVYRHYSIEGYPHNIAQIVSDEGYGKNDYIETTRPLVVVTAPGPGSGKMATCLSQLYHELQAGASMAGYAKFETFPIWNLPLKHPVNLAYEAATADLDDVNMIDPFHLQAYGETTVNYNRDVEVFPVLAAMFEKITGACPYKSPTDMGVNMAGNCITDDGACQEAARQEIVRRYYDALLRPPPGQGRGRHGVQAGAADAAGGHHPGDPPGGGRRPTRLAEETGEPAMAIQLPDGSMVTGKTSELMGCSAAALLNALKALSGAGGPRGPPHRPERHRAHPDRQGPVSGLQQPPAAQRRGAHRPGRLRQSGPQGRPGPGAAWPT